MVISNSGQEEGLTSVSYCASNDDYWFLYRNDYSVTSFAWNSFFQLAVQNFERNWILNLARLYSHHKYRFYFVHGWHYMLLEVRIISEKCTTLPWNCKSLYNVTHLFFVSFINFSQFQNTKVFSWYSRTFIHGVWILISCLTS